MGAADFTQSFDHPDVHSAFREAHGEAAFEHGHGGYSGTLAEKGEYVVIREAGKLSKQGAYALANRLMEADDQRIDDKWGPAGAIPYYDIKETSRTQRVTISTRLQATNLHGPDLLSLVQEARPPKSGERIEDIKILEDKRKVKVAAPNEPGKAVTTYHAGPAGSAPTLAEARAKAVNWLEANPDSWVSEIPITGSITRAAPAAQPNAKPLTIARRTITSRTLTLEVTYAKPTGATPTTPQGWLFFGWASS